MDIAFSNQVIARNQFGQFISAIEEGVTESVRESIEEGAKLSRALAPVGKKPDYRRKGPPSPKLNTTIKTEMLTPRSGIWYSDARHALPQETGAQAHQIFGMVSFFWDGAPEGPREWEPGTNYINHPGHGAQPFLGPAYDIIMGRKVIDIFDRNLPG